MHVNIVNWFLTKARRQQVQKSSTTAAHKNRLDTNLMPFDHAFNRDDRLRRKRKTEKLKDGTEENLDKDLTRRGTEERGDTTVRRIKELPTGSKCLLTTIGKELFSFHSKKTNRVWNGPSILTDTHHHRRHTNGRSPGSAALTSSGKFT